MEEFNLVDLLDRQDLPLKNRIDTEGVYQPLVPDQPLQKDEQYRFHFDMTRCVGCQCCVVACNEQNNNPSDVNWRRVGDIEGGVYPDTKRYHLSMACNHCLDPSCLTGCPTDAYVKLDSGVVKHQAEECIGCGYCTWNCPYGVPQYNSERNIVTKCDMCHERLKDGEMPACVAACPESAIQIEKVNVNEWRKNHSEADAPYMPDSEMTISTTRITKPKIVPDHMLRANRHRIEPEKPHTSLIFLTLFTQLAMGGFLTLWLGQLLSRFVSFLKPLQDFLVFGASGMLIVTGMALFAAIFHLGRPFYAYKAIRMWKRSWLSREVLLFAIFSKLGALYAGLLLLGTFWKPLIPQGAMDAIGALVVLSGILGVYASARIYLVPARPAWNTFRTPLRFFLTGFILGPLFALVIYCIYGLTQDPGFMDPQFKGPAIAFLQVTFIAGFLQLVVLLYRLLHLRENESYELYGATFLLIHRFKTAFWTRVGLLGVGALGIPFLLSNLFNVGQVAPVAFTVLAFLSFLSSILGEFVGRYLFFVTVVPKNMPGSFFTSNKGGH